VKQIIYEMTEMSIEDHARGYLPYLCAAVAFVFLVAFGSCIQSPEPTAPRPPITGQDQYFGADNQ